MSFFFPIEIKHIYACLAFISFLILCLFFYLKQKQHNEKHLYLLKGLLIILGIVSSVLFTSKSLYYFTNTIHLPDLYHYYMGSKYFTELGYTRLYECATVVDIEDGVVNENRSRMIRNLRTNNLMSTNKLLDTPDKYKKGFSSRRWQEFKKDIAYFRTTAYIKKEKVWAWPNMNRDHGFNGTPTWLLLARLYSNTGSASNWQMVALSLIDFFLIIIMWLVILWAFGLEGFCLAAIFLGTNFISIPGWTSGSFLRYDWLLFTVTGICFLRKGKSHIGGIAITYAACLRIFPAFLLAAIFLREILKCIKSRTFYFSNSFRYLLLGSVLMLFIIIPLSTYSTGRGWSVWYEFYKNSRTHLSTPFANNVGLKTIITYLDVHKKYESPKGDITAIKKQTFDNRKLIYILMVIGLFLIFLEIIKDKSDWETAILGSGIIFILFEIFNYYYSFLLLYAFFTFKRPNISLALCLLAFSSNIVAILCHQNIEIYFWLSVLIFAFILFAYIDIWCWGKQAPMQCSKRERRAAFLGTKS